LKKHVNKASKRLKHIRFDLISEKKQQENVSARQRAAGIKSMLRRERKLFAVGLKKIESDD
jgi:Arc/MetJ family transcription regulator